MQNKFFLCALVLSCIACSTIALPTWAAPLQRRNPTSPPSQDGFYSPSASTYGNLANGQLIASRALNPASSPGISDSRVGSAFQLSYRSSSMEGAAQPNVALVLAPKARPPGNGAPRLVAYLSPEDSAFLDCSPSWSWLQSADAEHQLVFQMLGAGYTVVIPDYEGPKSGFSAGKLAAQGTLDALRAALAFDAVVPAARRNEVTISAVGYSGGGLAASWVAQQLASYAPELAPKMVGVAAGGIPVNVTATFLKNNGGPNAGLSVAGLAGQSNIHPDLDGYLHSVLNDQGRRGLDDAKRKCSGAALHDYANVDISKFLTVNTNQFFASGAVRSALLESSVLGAAVPRVPLYVWQAVNDEIVPSADVDSWVSTQCKKGAQIHYVRKLAGQHLDVGIFGAPDALAFLASRHDRQRLPSGCTTTN